MCSQVRYDRPSKTYIIITLPYINSAVIQSIHLLQTGIPSLFDYLQFVTWSDTKFQTCIKPLTYFHFGKDN